MELKEKPGTIVGDFSFKGISPDGMIEIGYGLKKGYCKNGYMTETVKAVSAWALEQDEVTRVEAEETFAGFAVRIVAIAGERGYTKVRTRCANSLKQSDISIEAVWRRGGNSFGTGSI